ncbi:hypothetical protein EJB05_01730, partial [Eragrostis curvula]
MGGRIRVGEERDLVQVVDEVLVGEVVDYQWRWQDYRPRERFDHHTPPLPPPPPPPVPEADPFRDRWEQAQKQKEVENTMQIETVEKSRWSHHSEMLEGHEIRDAESSKVAARKVKYDKFTVRFPTAQMIKDWGRFRPLGMRTVQAQIAIDPWNASVGAKAELQQAWFRVRGIPYDKRSKKTLAYVGSLVGATIAIDTKSLYRQDYVRMKICCRDFTKKHYIPNKNDKDDPPPKKPRTEFPNTDTMFQSTSGTDTLTGNYNAAGGSYSAPPKTHNADKFMADAQRTYPKESLQLSNTKESAVVSVESAVDTDDDEEDILLEDYGPNLKADPDEGSGQNISVGLVQGDEDNLMAKITQKQMLKSTRQSERVQSQVAEKMKKLEMRSSTKKRNLEGTNLNSSNSFAVLDNSTIAELALNLGVCINNNFETVNIMKDLEVARHFLKDKLSSIVDSITLVNNEIVPIEEPVTVSNEVDLEPVAAEASVIVEENNGLLLQDWEHEDSEKKQFTLVQSKKRGNGKETLLAISATVQRLSNICYLSCVSKAVWSVIAICFNAQTRPSNLQQYWQWMKTSLPNGEKKARNKACFDKVIIKHPCDIIFHVCSFLRYWAGLYPADMREIVEARAQSMPQTAISILGRQRHEAPRKTIQGPAAAEDGPGIGNGEDV